MEPLSVIVCGNSLDAIVAASERRGLLRVAAFGEGRRLPQRDAPHHRHGVPRVREPRRRGYALLVFRRSALPGDHRVVATVDERVRADDQRQHEFLGMCQPPGCCKPADIQPDLAPRGRDVVRCERLGSQRQPSAPHQGQSAMLPCRSQTRERAREEPRAGRLLGASDVFGGVVLQDAWGLVHGTADARRGHGDRVTHGERG
mmetsp:Transcript_77043/g.214275  ORF Transcript_77043/g.214275 Transcript_77043/m.214275 type:complete len:202 (+) Transcript_77043:935-1540(+)